MPDQWHLWGKLQIKSEAPQFHNMSNYHLWENMWDGWMLLMNEDIWTTHINEGGIACLHACMCSDAAHAFICLGQTLHREYVPWLQNYNQGHILSCGGLRPGHQRIWSEEIEKWWRPHYISLWKIQLVDYNLSKYIWRHGKLLDGLMEALNRPVGGFPECTTAPTGTKHHLNKWSHPKSHQSGSGISAHDKAQQALCWGLHSALIWKTCGHIIILTTQAYH